MWRHRFRRTTLLSIGLLGVLLGLCLPLFAERVPEELIIIGLTISFVAFSRQRLLALLSVLLLGLSIGSWRGFLVHEQLAPINDLYDQKVMVVVRAVEDAGYSRNAQLSFAADDISFIEPYTLSVPGQLIVQGFGLPSVGKGDIVVAEGKLRDMRGSKVGILSFAELYRQENGGSFADTVRRKFVGGLVTSLPEPQASLSAGILIGQRSGLPVGVQDDMSRAGLTHIVAVSGYNLTIIIGAIQTLMRRRSRYQALVLCLAVTGVFILMTGFSASIVRAGLVAILGLWAWYYGRKFNPILLILLAAALTAMWNPLYVWADVGWYLSFTAFFGILVLAPLIRTRLRIRSDKLLTGIIIETSCAVLCTAPLIIYIFGELSSVALLANMLVLPLVPLAMLLSVVAGIAGMYFPVLSAYIALPARYVITYIIDITNIMANIPGSQLQISSNFAQMLFLYGAILLLAVILARHQRDTITPKQDFVLDVRSSQFIS
jgi:competence protein ComEC